MTRYARNVSVSDHSLRAQAMVATAARLYIEGMNNVTTASAVLPSASRRFTGAGIATMLSGAVLCFIGVRFLLVPSAAAAGFGVPLTGIAAYAYAKGIRDLVFGGLLVGLTLLGERRAAALVLLGGALIPIVDGAIVLASRGVQPGFLAVHWGTAVLCVALGVMQIRRPGR